MTTKSEGFWLSASGENHGTDSRPGDRWVTLADLTGAELIAMERREQLEKHKWSPEHDDEHTDGSLRVVAATLACDGTDAKVSDPLYRGSDNDPWGLLSKLKGDENRVHRLTVAGALIAAEIDRIQRESPKHSRSRNTRRPDCMD